MGHQAWQIFVQHFLGIPNYECNSPSGHFYWERPPPPKMIIDIQCLRCFAHLLARSQCGATEPQNSQSPGKNLQSKELWRTAVPKRRFVAGFFCRKKDPYVSIPYVCIADVAIWLSIAYISIHTYPFHIISIACLRIFCMCMNGIENKSRVGSWRISRALGNL